jgi:hypothetical protein
MSMSMWGLTATVLATHVHVPELYWRCHTPLVAFLVGSPSGWPTYDEYSGSHIERLPRPPAWPP